MRVRKVLFIVALFFVLLYELCSQESSGRQFSVQVLLKGYLEHDLSLKNLSAEVQKQILENSATKISNGFTFNIETGTVTVNTGSDAFAKFSPSAGISVPQANNLSLSLSSSVKIDDNDSNDLYTDTALSAGIDLYSGSGKKRNVTLLKSERTVLEAKRKLQDGYLSSEKEFYESLKSLYKTASEISSAEKSLYDDTLDFEEIKALEYETTSPKYRSANMKVISDWRTVEIKRRELERETKIFASKCGIEYDGKNALSFLPSDIPDVQAVDILDFNKNCYSKIESALWTQKINNLSRAADISVTLSANAGYTFKNTGTLNNSDTVDAGATLKLHDTGLSFNSGVSVPVDSTNHDPVYKFGLSFTPNPFRLAKISDAQEKLEIEQENISIKSAENNYDTSVISQQTALDDLLWTKKNNEYMYDLYSDQERDLASYYRQGFISQSEYMSAKVNKETYRINKLVNAIDIILYNQETELLFCRDTEINDGQ
ncbi:MAG: hypothetical protein K6G00_02530 [Treponema sp.]|nr:hypothetical protein [Treponema sp.]